MRIAVIGAGATGGLYGGLLARAGHDVRFLARGAHLAAIRERGLEVRSAQFGSFNVRAPASSDPRELGPAEFVLLAVKTYDLEPAAEAARHLLGEDAALLTLQNGLEAPDQVARAVGAARVLIGTTGVEGTLAEPGLVAQLSQAHFITVSEYEGPPTPRVNSMVELLKSAGMNARVADDGRRALWTKARLLIPLATITSICQAPLGPIRELPETRELLGTLIRELETVARAYGYELAGESERDRSFIQSMPSSMKASMARDFERGGRTELDALTGGLLRLAEARGVDVPATRTAYAVLKLREVSAREQAGQALESRGAALAEVRSDSHSR